MPLQGALDEFGIEPLLVLFASARSTGVLHIEDEALCASLWMRDGSCVWAHTDLRRTGLRPEEVLIDTVFEIAVHNAGKFRFYACDAADLGPPSVASIDTDALCQEVAERRRQWEVVRFRLDEPVELIADDPPGDVVIRPSEWRVLAQISAGLTLRDLLASGSGLWSVGCNVVALVRAGLVRIGAGEAVPVQQSVPALEVVPSMGVDARPRVRRARPTDLMTELADLSQSAAAAAMLDDVDDEAQAEEVAPARESLVAQSEQRVRAPGRRVRRPAADDVTSDERREALDALRSIAEDLDDHDRSDEAVGGVRSAHTARRTRMLGLLAREG